MVCSVYKAAAVAVCCCLGSTFAFTAPSSPATRSMRTVLFADEEPASETPAEKLKRKSEAYVEPRMNPDRPELPELKGDFDWDAKFGGDDDWITEDVPGKIVLNEIELAKQIAEMDKLEEKWRKQRLQEEYDEARILGFTEKAESFNGRAAMFFLVVGLLTEYWTGITLPGQVEEMLRVGGIIGVDT